MQCCACQVAFIKAHQLGFEELEAEEFGELQALLAKVEASCGNRDFAHSLQQGFHPGAFFKVLVLVQGFRV